MLKRSVFSRVLVLNHSQPALSSTQTVYTQAQCPANPAVRAVVQNAQVAALNLYKRMGGKSILVDCGDAGTFAY